MIFLMLGGFLNALRTERIESESISFRKHWYFLGMLSSEIILEKKPLKISHNSVSLEIFLPFSIRLIFSPFKGLFVKRGIIVFQKVLLSVTFLPPDHCSMIFFVVLSNFFTKTYLMIEVLLIIFSSVPQKRIS